MPNTNTLTALTAEQKTFYERTLLSRLLPNLLFYKYGQKKSVPKNEGKVVNFRRFNSLEANTTALTEGKPGDGKALDITTITATLSQHGDYLVITDVLDMVGMDPVLTESCELLGEQAALSVDTIVRDIVCSGTNVHYVGGAAGADALTAASILTGTDVRKAVRTLKRNNVKPLEDGFYIGIVHPDVAFDLMSDPLWQDVSKYNGGTQIIAGEIGKIHGVRFVESTNTTINPNASAVDIYGTMIIGKDAYGVVDLEGQGAGKPQIIVKPHGSAGTADPLNQLSTAGWKCMFTAARLQELGMVRIESAATAA